MSESRLSINTSMKLVCHRYAPDMSPDVSIDYINFSCDHWYGDEEKSIEISKDKAIEIIKFLNDSFGLTTLGDCDG